MPVEITPAGPENIPDTGFPEGHVSAANNPAEPPLQHRPHAFALMYGDGGAKVAYGQLMWRVDRVDFAFEGDSVGGSDGNCIGAGQGRAIKGLDAVIPKLNSSSGDAMDPTIPNIYHQLDGYGDVYLFWEVDLAESEIVVSCWVEASGAPSGETPNDIDDFDTGNADHDRFAGVDGSLDSTGIYRVKLGTVNEGALIAQDISSDVYWSTVVLTRDQAS